MAWELGNCRLILMDSFVVVVAVVVSSWVSTSQGEGAGLVIVRLLVRSSVGAVREFFSLQF